MRYQKCSATGTGTSVNPVTVTHGADSSEMLSEPFPWPYGRGHGKLWTDDKTYDRGECILTKAHVLFEWFIFFWWLTIELKLSQITLLYVILLSFMELIIFKIVLYICFPGWWFDACGPSNLNGMYFAQGQHIGKLNGIKWHYFKGPSYSLRATTMMIRPLDFS